MQKSNELKELERIAHGIQSTKKELLEIFIRQTTMQIAQMKSCLQNKDWKELTKIAHSMKSVFLHIKMIRPIELTELIMTTAGIDIKATIQQVNELADICSLLTDEFNSELKTAF